MLSLYLWAQARSTSAMVLGASRERMRGAPGRWITTSSSILMPRPRKRFGACSLSSLMYKPVTKRRKTGSQFIHQAEGTDAGERNGEQVLVGWSHVSTQPTEMVGRAPSLGQGKLGCDLTPGSHDTIVLFFWYFIQALPWFYVTLDNHHFGSRKDSRP